MRRTAALGGVLALVVLVAAAAALGKPDLVSRGRTAAVVDADLALAKTVSNAMPNVGDQITFTVTLSNGGPGTATNVTVQDLLPAGLSFVSATPSQGSYNPASGVWTVGTVNTGPAQTLAIIAKVVSSTARTNTATISHSDAFDPNTGNNTASATETPQLADLALAKTVSNATPNVGDTIMFTITLSNNGPDTATNVTVQDLLPAGLSVVTATASQGSYNSGTGVWTVGTVTTAPPRTLTISAVVSSPRTQTNTARISHAAQFDPNVGNNAASATVTPQRADLTITKSVSNPAPNVGDNITFTITVTNAGPDTASNVTVGDSLPPGLTFLVGNPSQGTYVPGTGVWTVGTVTTGTPETLTITANVNTPSPQTNTATISHSDQFDPNTGNNSAAATETPQQADLAIAKRTSNPSPGPGDAVIFTITLFNSGPNVATNVTVQDTLPAGYLFGAATTSQGIYNSGTGVWTVGTVTTSTPQTLTITTTATSPSPGGNTASVFHSDQFDPNVSNNSDTTSTDSLQADLFLLKSVSNAHPNVGDKVTFTITLIDNGPATATGVSVQDSLPAGLTFFSATPSQGTYVSGTGAWSVGTVGAGASATLTITATVVSPNPATNTASVSASDQFDPVTGNNSGSATVTPQVADLHVTKQVNNSSPNVGDQVTFTITLTNAGADTATGVRVNDSLPAGLTFVSANPSQGTYNPGTGLWDVGTVIPGTPSTLTITATVTGASQGVNTATISHSDQFDSNVGNNNASAIETPQQADLSLTKTTSDIPPNVPNQYTFTITVANAGPDIATGVQVIDTLPSGAVFVSATPSQGSYNSGTGVWTVGTVGAGASATLTITATIVSPTARTNTASISHADQFDPNAANNTDSATAVTLASLTAARTRAGVVVRWRTGTEADVLGFHVYRVHAGKSVRVDRRLIPSRGSVSGARHSFLDRRAPRGKVSYRLQAVDTNGARTWYGPVSVSR